MGKNVRYIWHNVIQSARQHKPTESTRTRNKCLFTVDIGIFYSYNCQSFLFCHKRMQPRDSTIFLEHFKIPASRAIYKFTKKSRGIKAAELQNAY